MLKWSSKKFEKGWSEAKWNLNVSCQPDLFMSEIKASFDELSHLVYQSLYSGWIKEGHFFLTKTTKSNSTSQENREIHCDWLRRGILSVRRWTWRCQPQSLFKWFTGFSFTLTFPLSCIILLFLSLSLSRSQRKWLPVIRSFICVFTARNVHPPLHPAPLFLILSSPNPTFSQKTLSGNINLRQHS